MQLASRPTAVIRAITQAWPYADAETAETRQRADILAASDSGMSADQSRDLALFAHAAVNALQMGTATSVDANNLAVISNIAMLLAECGFGAEALDQFTAGQTAVVAVLDRQARTGRAVATGPELQAIRMLVELHDEQLHLSPSQRQMMAVLAEMRRRMADGEVMS